MDKVVSNTQNHPGMQASAKNIMLSMMEKIDVQVDGQRDWDIQVHNEQLYSRVFKEGPVGLGEAYMDGWWDCKRLDLLFEKVLRGRLDRELSIPLHFKLRLLLAKVINYQSKHRAKEVALKHYNLGNQLFTRMLDPTMSYSCGYWKNATRLEEAQLAKLDLICKKLQLQPGMRLLDIGCGWGGLAKFAAEHYGVSVVGITISQQQNDYAKKLCSGLPVEIRLQDYRDIEQSFDRVVSVGMFEHVGHLNYHTYMKTIHRALNPEGLFLLHTIGTDQTTLFANEWITKYIFPNGMLPSIQLIGKAVEPYFIMEDWHNFSAYYDPTLMAWYHNFVKHWPELQKEYDERFYRMWVYYLLSCAGGFRARAIQLWQIVFSKQGIVGGYHSVR